MPRNANKEYSRLDCPRQLTGSDVNVPTAQKRTVSHGREANDWSSDYSGLEGRTGAGDEPIVRGFSVLRRGIGRRLSHAKISRSR